MNKLMTVVTASVCAVVIVTSARAAEDASGEGSRKVAVDQAEVQEEEADWFSAGFAADLFSAYVFRNAVFNDEFVLQPCVWGDLTLFDFLTVGGNVWQNWNLSDSWSPDGIPREMNETDFNLHVGADVWTSDDGKYTLNLQLGHDFFTYRYDYPSENEVTLQSEFVNPFVNVYGKYCQAYVPVSACHFEFGLRKDRIVGELLESENDVLNRLRAGFDWNVNFASGRFFSNYIWGFKQGAYNPETEEYDEDCMSDGIGGTTIKLNLAYEVCEHFSIGLLGAFTSALSDEARDTIEYMGHGGSYKDIFWGGLQVVLNF